MKINKILVPAVALVATMDNYNKVEAGCIEVCVGIQAAGAKACSVAWVNPPAYFVCISAVSAAFTVCCINCK